MEVLSILFVYQGFKNPLKLNSSDFRYRSQVTIFWSLSLFVILLNSTENLIARFFSSCVLLKSFGKFSFGIYLLTPCANMLVKNLNFTTQFEHIVWCILIAYVYGFVFFHLIETPLIKLANQICWLLESRIRFFNQEQRTLTRM